MTSRLFDLQGRVALVTGAGRGLGATIAEALASHGARVAVNDVDADRASAVADRMCSRGARAVAVPGDVTDRTSVDAVAGAARSALGGIDILVNNAGIPPDGVGAGPFAESEPAHWERLVALNLFGVLHCVHAVLPGMIERGYGRIVTMVSDAARVGEPNIAVYGAAKAAAASFSRSLAKEVGAQGVTANCISLGSLVTERQTPESIARHGRRYPVGRLGQPDDVVPVVLLLCASESAWITGQTYGVDGGYATS